MRRGFKTQAEKLSLKHRSSLGLSVSDRLDPKVLLASIGVMVWAPADIPGLDPNHLTQLTTVDPDSWSGVTIKEGEVTLVIVNPAHPATRQSNTLMHEWAHIELRHKPSRADRSEGGLLLLSDYPPELEEEADWLAGCMLAPRDGLLHHCSNGQNTKAVAKHYGISTQLANWRIRKTGIKRQLGSRLY